MRLGPGLTNWVVVRVGDSYTKVNPPNNIFIRNVMETFMELCKLNVHKFELQMKHSKSQTYTFMQALAFANRITSIISYSSNLVSFY